MRQQHSSTSGKSGLSLSPTTPSLPARTGCARSLKPRPSRPLPRLLATKALFKFVRRGIYGAPPGKFTVYSIVKVLTHSPKVLTHPRYSPCTRSSRVSWSSCGWGSRTTSLVRTSALMHVPCAEPLCISLVQSPCAWPLCRALVHGPCAWPLCMALVHGPCAEPLCIALIPCAWPFCISYRGSPQARRSAIVYVAIVDYHQ